MSAESERKNLPFEPNKKPKKTASIAAKKPVVKSQSGNQGKKVPYTKEEMAVPKVVSDRMVRRVVGFCGIPTVLGITTLVASYLLIVFANIKLPPIAVLLANLGFFGLGVLGITYGVLSASWDIDRPGTILGWNEFTTNFGRMVEVWRATKQKKV
jgi:Photosynthesis affected mutant 68